MFTTQICIPVTHNRVPDREEKGKPINDARHGRCHPLASRGAARAPPSRRRRARLRSRRSETPPESLRARETTQCPYRCETPSLWVRRRAQFSPAVIALLRGAPLESRIGFRNALFEPQKREKHEEREFAQEKPTRRMNRCGRSGLLGWGRRI